MSDTVGSDETSAADASRRGFTVRALGEIAIRCTDVARMVAFYRDVIGLTLFARRPRGDREIVFFSLGESYGGHTAVLALFPQDAPLDPYDGARHRAGPLHHLALTVDAGEQARVIAWYESIGQPFHVVDFEWTGWRGVFTKDPEGNTVELVASVAPAAAAPAS